MDPTEFLAIFSLHSGNVRFPKHVLFRLLDSAQIQKPGHPKKYAFGLLGVFVKEFMMLHFMTFCCM
jgi:hypothetical protein